MLLTHEKPSTNSSIPAPKHQTSQGQKYSTGQQTVQGMQEPGQPSSEAFGAKGTFMYFPYSRQQKYQSRDSKKNPKMLN